MTDPFLSSVVDYISHSFHFIIFQNIIPNIMCYCIEYYTCIYILILQYKPMDRLLQVFVPKTLTLTVIYVFIYHEFRFICVILLLFNTAVPESHSSILLISQVQFLDCCSPHHAAAACGIFQQSLLVTQWVPV